MFKFICVILVSLFITSLTLAQEDTKELSRKRRVNSEESFLLSGKDSFF